MVRRRLGGKLRHEVVWGWTPLISLPWDREAQRAIESQRLSVGREFWRREGPIRTSISDQYGCEKVVCERVKLEANRLVMGD